MTAPPGSGCLGPRCQEDDEPRDPYAGHLCKRCFGQLQQTVAELPAVHFWLGANIASGGTRASGDVITGSRERPLPIRASVHDHQNEIQSVLVSWVRLVCEERDLRGPDRSDVNSTASWLGSQLDWCAEQPWVDDLAVEVRDLARVAHRLVPWRPGRHHLPEACPACETRSLVRYDGAAEVQCSQCQERFPEVEYERLALVLRSQREAS